MRIGVGLVPMRVIPVSRKIVCMESQTIILSWDDESLGYAVSPERMPLSALHQFVRDVDEFVRGDVASRRAPAAEVSVVQGSFGLRVSSALDPALPHDLQRLAAGPMLDDVSPRRRAVVERWQKAARSARKGAGRPRVRIAAAFLPAPIVIDSASDFRARQADQWVRVERYVQGEVEEAGGSERVNAHIRLPHGQRLTVDVDRGVLRDDKLNRLFKPSTVRISAEYNLATRQHRNAKLIEFVDYAPRFDEAEFERLTDLGRQAWKDVPDASAWVESLRGSAE